MLRKQLHDCMISTKKNSALFRKWKWEFLKENKQVLNTFTCIVVRAPPATEYHFLIAGKCLDSAR